MGVSRGAEVATAANDAFLRRCGALCAASARFARLALPPLAYDLATRDATAAERIFGEEGLREAPGVVVEVVEYCRGRELEQFLFGRGLPLEWPLLSDGSALADASLRADRPSSAAFFAELCGSRELAVAAYARLEDADALRALTAHHASLETRLALYKAEGDWSSALGLADAALSTFEGGPSLRAVVADALQQLGFAHVAHAYARSTAHDDAVVAALADTRHATAWRALSIRDDDDDDEDYGGFDGSVRDALRRIAARDCAGAERALDKARDAAMLRLDRLAAVAEAREAVAGLRQRLRDADDDALVACVRRRDQSGLLGLAAREGWLRATRRALSDDAGDDELRRTIDNELRETIRAVAAEATSAGCVERAEAAAARLGREVADDASRRGAEWRRWLQVAEAKTSWARGRRDEAMRRVSAVACNDKDESAVRLEALRLAGAWAVEARSLPASVVLDSYLRPAARQDGEARYALADYVSRLHADAVKRLSSPEWQQAERVAAERRRELELCRERMAETPESSDEYQTLRRQTRVLETECDADAATRDAHLASKHASFLEALALVSTRPRRGRQLLGDARRRQLCRSLVRFVCRRL